MEIQSKSQQFNTMVEYTISLHIMGKCFGLNSAIITPIQKNIFKEYHSLIYLVPYWPDDGRMKAETSCPNMTLVYKSHHFIELWCFRRYFNIQDELFNILL
jgi:hypothetical protein